MSRLFVLTIAAIFGYMLWRIIRVVIRGRSTTTDEHRDNLFEGPAAHTPREKFRDVRDADFEELKPPPPRTPPGPPASGS